MSDRSLGGASGGTKVAGAAARWGGIVPQSSVDEVDLARGREYALLARLLARAPDRSLLERLAALLGDSSPLGVAHTELAQPPVGPVSSVSSANTLISSSALGGGSCCLTGRIIFQAFFTSDRLRACARIWLSSASNGPRANRSPKITLRCYARLWRGLRMASYRRRRVPTARYSSNICRRGSGDFSLTWSAPRPPTSTARLGPSARYSSRSRPPPSRWRRRQTVNCRRNSGDEERTEQRPKG